MDADLVSECVEAFFEDCKRDGREPTPENLRAWLWFTCPAPLRPAVRDAIARDERFPREEPPR